MSSSRRNFGILLFFSLLSFGIFYRTLSYSFHYDDYVKLVFNRAGHSVTAAFRSFFDRDAQSPNKELNTHMYRPLFAVTLAIQYQLFGDHPAGYRFCNILLHGINAGLVALLAYQLLGLGWRGSAVAGFVFLAHPAQVETTVWIVEISSLLAGTCLLTGLYLWSSKERPLRISRALTIVGLFITALMFKETAAAFPFVITLAAIMTEKNNTDRRQAFQLIIVLFILMGLYLALRHHILGRTSNIWLTQFSWREYLAPIHVGLVMALGFLLFPLNSTIDHQPWLAPASDALLVTYGVLLPLLVLSAAVYGLVRHKKKWAFCICLMIALWLPTSQIIPIRGIFAERFLYFVLAPFGFLCGLLFDRSPAWGRGAMALYVVVLVLLTGRIIPNWKNDGTLWDNAISRNPSYWHPWVLSAEWEKTNASMRRRLGEPEPAKWKERAEEKYIKGLKCGVPAESAGDVFLRLAEINRLQGKMNDAKIHAQRGEELRRNHVERLKT